MRIIAGPCQHETNMLKLQDFESIVDEIHRYRYTG